MIELAASKGMSARVSFQQADAMTLPFAEASLTAAGFADTVYESIACTGTCDSAHDAAEGLCHGTPLRLQIEERDSGALARVTDAVAHALRERFGEDLGQAKMRANIYTAWKP